METRTMKARSPQEGGSASQRPSPDVGDVVGGKYRLERHIGAGGMGYVMAARHLELDELFAIKFLERGDEPDVIAEARFYREARATLRLKNEHVVRVVDASSGGGEALPYIIMEYLDGADLSQVLHGSGPLPVATAVGYALQACEALAEAHLFGIVHRDIKLSNLLLTSTVDGAPLVKVLDFGISKTASDSGDMTLTETGAVFGSTPYMSPEQLRSTKTVDHRTDVWSLGVVLYSLLCGSPPFGADSTTALSISIVVDAPRPPRELRPDMPVELERVLLACLEKDRDARVQSIAELALRLRPFADVLGLQSCDAVARIASAAPPSPDSSRSLIPAAIPSANPSAPITFAATDRQQPLGAARRSWKIAAAAGAGALLGLGVIAGVLFSRAGTPSQAARAASSPQPQPLASASVSGDAPSLPPAGSLGRAVGAPVTSAVPSDPAGGVATNGHPGPKSSPSPLATAGRPSPSPSPGAKGVAPGRTSTLPTGAPAVPSNRPGPNGADPELGSRY